MGRILEQGIGILQKHSCYVPVVPCHLEWKTSIGSVSQSVGMTDSNNLGGLLTKPIISIGKAISSSMIYIMPQQLKIRKNDPGNTTLNS